MKNCLYLFLALSLGRVSPTTAQTPLNVIDSIDINNINAAVLVHGDMWFDPVTYLSKCRYPKNTGKSINFAASPWISGYDASGQLHVAAQTYRQTGVDFWPGPIDPATGGISLLQSQNWAKIWKINRSDIQYFRTLSTHTTANTPSTILTWPARGNTLATGYMGAPLAIVGTTSMAPFVDINGNGIYEPLAGDYPDVKGDQALWWVFNDNGPAHTATGGTPMGVEIHAMAYAYKRGTLLDNVVYYEYEVVNRSSNNYHNVRFSLFSDIEIGYYHDDYIGFDSTWRMGIGYNAALADGMEGGFPETSYGSLPPVTGITFISVPGDLGTNYTPLGSFDYFIPGSNQPTSPSEYNNFMRSKHSDGSPFTNDFSGRGHTAYGVGTGPSIKYVYPGEPRDTTQWSECNSGNGPFDRSFIISSNDFTLAPGQIQRVVMALVTTDTNQGGCPNVGFGPIKTVADTAWHDFYNPPPPLPLAITNIAGNIENFELYPNPAHDKINLVSPSGFAQHTQVQVFNTLGQEMHTTIETNNTTKEISTAALPEGVYYILLQNGSNRQALRFIKE